MENLNPEEKGGGATLVIVMVLGVIVVLSLVKWLIG